jgi:hypothetical protein
VSTYWCYDPAWRANLIAKRARWSHLANVEPDPDLDLD